MRIKHLRVNHLENPIGYDFSYLTLSWKVEEAVAKYSDEERLIISETEDMSELVYDSGILHDFRQCRMEVQMNLKPRTRYFWKVFVEEHNAGVQSTGSAESETAWFETAKLEEKWKADWISVPEDKTRMPVLYRDFAVENKLTKARLYIFGAGLYEVDINGTKAGDEYLLPGYHSYDLLMEYQTFDVTEMLEKGDNRISVLLGEGWYKGRFGFDDVYLDLYGDRKKCIAELHLEYESGETACIITDASWKAQESNILENGIYDGEWQDDTLKSAQLTVEVLQDDKSLLTARTNPPIRKTEEFIPVSEEVHPDGYLLLDFGESITGWVEFSGLL